MTYYTISAIEDLMNRYVERNAEIIEVVKV